ncbi:male-specific histamine-binding salivary protein-like [Amblyomma americanum]
MVKSFIMQLLAFFAIVGLAYSEEAPDSVGQLSTQGGHPLWADEGRLGQYQDAWKSINQSNATLYYLAMATYQNDSASWGTMFQCVSVNETRRNETTKTVWSQFIFRNASSKGNETFNVTEEVKAINYYGYENYTNAIKYILERGYELWVNGDLINEIPSCCIFMLYFFAGENRTVYDIYNKGECASAPTQPKK